MKSNFLLTNLIILLFIVVSPDISGQPKSKTDIQTIVNGRVWVPTTSVSLGEQFFLEKMNLNGSLLYEGIQFNNVDFSYDLAEEIVITTIETETKTKRNIIINPYCLEGFNVNNHSSNFKFVRGDLLHKNLDSLRYYQVINSRNFQYLIMRKKHRKLKSNNSNTYKYVSINSLYIIKEGDLIPINGKKDILNLFPHQKKEMRKYISSSKLKIRTKTPMDAVPLLLKFDL